MTLKQKLASGEIINGIMLSELYTPNIIRVLKNCGYDFVLVDCEHGYFDLSHTANLIALADGINLPLIVRATYNSKDDISKYLDMGAQGILMSNVTSVQQAAELVDLCLYAPLGNRGISTFRAHTGYHSGNIKETLSRANARTIVIAQIESPEGDALVDDILDKPQPVQQWVQWQ